MAFTQVTLAGHFYTAALADATGEIEFEPTGAMALSSADQIVPKITHRRVLAAGAFSIVLPATDDVGVQPTGVLYRVTEKIDGAQSRTYYIDLPKATTSVNLADITPTETQPPRYGYALQSALDAHLADTVDAHDASAISFAPDGNIAATTVQAAVAEVRDDAATALTTHEADTTGVHGITDTSTLYRSGGTDVAVADGGTGSSTAAGARTNLGLGTAAVEAATAFDAAGTATSAVSAHEADSTSVHGIADTSTLYRAGGTDVAVADGGTGASTAAGARTALGLVIGTDVQGYDADLATWAGLTPSANGQSFVTAADYAAMRTLLGLVIGTNVQAFDADLAAIAALTSSADKGIHATGTGAWAIHDLTAFARTILDDADASTALSTLGVSTFVKTILDDADAAAVRTTLGLGTAAVKATGYTTGTLPLVSGGTPDGSKFLRDDGVWTASSGGAPSGAAGGVLGGTYPNPSFAADMATQAELDAHTGDASAAHAASAVSLDPAGFNFVSDADVQAALDTLDQSLQEHREGTLGVGTEHLAQHVGFDGTGTGYLDGTSEVQSALVALDDALDGVYAEFAATAIPKTTVNANSVLYGVTDDTPAALSMGASTILARLASGDIVAATPTQLRTLLALTVGTNVQAWDADLDSLASVGITAAGLALLDDAAASNQRTTLGLGTMATATATDYVTKALFDANTILAATTDDTPAAVTVAASTFVGRKATGNIAAMSVAEVTVLLADTFAPRSHEVTYVRPRTIADTGVWTPTIGTTSWMNGALVSAGVQSSKVSYDFILAAGTWTLGLAHRTGTDRGIYTFDLDGTALTSFSAGSTTMDGYAAAAAQAATTITGIVIPTTTVYRLNITMATKNASSSSYVGFFSEIALVRTA